MLIPQDFSTYHAAGRRKGRFASMSWLPPSKLTSTLAAKGKLQSELSCTRANPLLLEQHLTFCPEIRSTHRCHQPSAHPLLRLDPEPLSCREKDEDHICTVGTELSQLTRKHWMELTLPPEVVLIFFLHLEGNAGV